MKIPALIGAVAVSSGIGVMDAVALVNGNGSWPILIGAGITFSISFALLWTEAVDRW